MRTGEKYPENAILLWNMGEIIADKCHSDKTLWHNKVPLRGKGVSESKQELQGMISSDKTGNPRKKHPYLLQENRLGSLESLLQGSKSLASRSKRKNNPWFKCSFSGNSLMKLVSKLISVIFCIFLFKPEAGKNLWWCGVYRLQVLNWKGNLLHTKTASQNMIQAKSCHCSCE